MDLSVIIVSYNTDKLTKECIESVIKKTRNINIEIIVIDNDSKDESVKSIKKLHDKYDTPIRLIINKENKGFGSANNQGINKAKGKYILFLNSDTLINTNVLGEMVDWMDKNEKVGVVSCALTNPDGSFQGTGGYFPTLIRVFSWMTIQDFPLVDKVIKPFHPMKENSRFTGKKFYEDMKELDWVTGAFLLTRKTILDDVKGFDKEYFMYTEETDLCYRIKEKGWKVVYLPKWKILHYGGASGSSENSILREYKGVRLFYEKHYEIWKLFVLILLLRLGSLLRMIAFFLKGDKYKSKIYKKAMFVG